MAKPKKTLKTYKVNMVGLAFVKGSIEVEASSDQEARDRAAERVGDVSWRYDGLDNISEALTEVYEISEK